MNENPTVEVNKLQPITKFIYTLGVLPTSYLMSMTFQEQLTWLCNFISTTLIPAINNDVEAVQELQNLYIELQEYVNNYFDNLDVQDEINNKIDAMAEAGYFQTLVENYAQPILSDLTSEVNALADEVEEATEDLSTKIEELRKEKYNRYNVYDIPFSNSIFSKLIVYRSNDKQNIRYYIDESSLKNTESTTYYVSKTGNNSNNGTTEETAWASIGYAVRNASSGSKIIIKSGIYYRDSLPDSTQIIQNALDIYGEDETYLVMGDNLVWTQNSTYTNVYQANRSNIANENVIDIRGRKNKVFSNLIKKSSLAEVSQTLNSFYTDGSIVYVNIGEAVTSEKVVCCLASGYPVLNIVPNENNKYYFENLVILGGNFGCLTIGNTSSYRATCGAKNCYFLYGGSSGKNVVDIAGSDGIFINCKANYGFKDGFNYSLANSQSSCGIEINCEGSNNGLLNDNTNNGSTGHNGSHIVRINGNYFNNKGTNVADVHENTISYNFNCNAFDSVSTDEGYSADFSPQQSGTVMYLVNCYAKGNSHSSIYCPTGATCYLDNCDYNNTNGNGTINIVE